MTTGEDRWWQEGQGVAPHRRWSFGTDAPLVSMALSRETGECVVVDDAGGLYRLGRTGRIETLSRGFGSPGALAWSDGGRGAIAVGSEKLSVFDEKLHVEWQRSLPAAILDVAITPLGTHVAASLSNGETLVFESGGRRLTTFRTLRPLHRLEFLVTVPHLLGAADHGFLCRRKLDGTPVWDVDRWSNAGDLAATGDGEHVFLAAYNRGIQCFDGAGRSAGTLMTDGTPSLVAASYERYRLAVATVEGHLFWMQPDGHLVWAARTPEPVRNLCGPPLGEGLVAGFPSGRIVRLDWA